MIRPRPFLYVNVGHMMKLTGCKETYCYAELKKMREKYHVVKPHKVTVDMVLDSRKITEEQFFSLFKDGGGRNKIDPKNTPPPPDSPDSTIPPIPPIPPAPPLP